MSPTKPNVKPDHLKVIKELEEITKSSISVREVTTLTNHLLYNVKQFGIFIQDSEIIGIRLPEHNFVKIPESIEKLKSLKLLDLSKNQLEELPDSLGSLTSLNTLNLNNNQLKNLPQSIVKLKNLRYLSLRGNKLEHIPDCIKNLDFLNTLEIEHEHILMHEHAQIINKIERNLGRIIPYRKEIGMTYTREGVITNMNSNEFEGFPIEHDIGIKAENGLVIGLGLNDCGLREVNEEIGNLKTLKELWLGNLDYRSYGREAEANNFTSLPDSIGNLKALEILNLSRVSDLNVLPESISELESLKDLTIIDCSLAALPKNLGNLTSLEILYLVAPSKTFFNRPPDSIKRLKLLPEYICELIHLKKLDLDNHDLLMLPENFGNLTSLETLFLNENNISSLPESFGNLSFLRKLFLKNNNLTNLPNIFGNLNSLKELDLDGNNLIKLPENFGNLSSLETLQIGNLKMKVTSVKIDSDMSKVFPGQGRFENDVKVDLRPNTLLSLPESFGNLKSLKDLYLRGNQLETLPDSFRKLKKLETLDIRYNKFKKLPLSLGGLENLTKLQVDDNPFEGETKKFFERYDKRENVSTFEKYLEKRDIPVLLKFLRKQEKKEEEKKEEEQIELIREKGREIVKKLPKIYKEITFERLSSRTGLKKDILENLLEEMIYKEEINAKIRKNVLVFEMETPPALATTELLVDIGFNIFLSYSTLDSEHYQIPMVASELEKDPLIDKVNYWEENSGENIVDFMERILRISKVFLLFCSQNALDSQSVEDEWQAAFQLRKRGKMKIIPVYENEEDIPRLLWPMLNVEYTKNDFNGFLKNLKKEIYRE